MSIATSPSRAGSLTEPRDSLAGADFTARHLLVILVAALAVLGLIMVPSSATTARPSFQHQTLFLRHASFLLVGLFAAWICSRLSERTWWRLAPALYICSLVGLGLVLVPGIGTEVNGARRWLRLGPLSVQVSEFARIATILFLARIGSRVATSGWRFTDVVRFGLVAVATVGFVLAEPDFGGAALILVAALLLAFLAGLPWAYSLGSAVIGVAGVAAAAVAAPYRVERLMQFLATWRSIDTAPYQVRQSLLSFASGGIWGTGLGAGWQKLGFLPESHTDYVFAVIGEELGLVGALTVATAWGLFLLCIWRLGIRPASRFAALATLGLGLSTAIQAFLHMAVVVALLPPKGIGLPFVSYGGSNLTASLASVGIIMALTRDRGDANSMT